MITLEAYYNVCRKHANVWHSAFSITPCTDYSK